MRNFLDEFKQRIAAHNTIVPKEEKKECVPQSNKEKRYNIHKRSLPVGIDKVIVFNVPKRLAEWLVETKLKTKLYHTSRLTKEQIENGVVDEQLDKTYIYYDIVDQEATPKERSIYYNSGDITI